VSFTLNATTNEPSLSDLLSLLKKEIMLELNSHHVGTVQSFNSTAMTVVATVNYTKTFFERNSSTNQYVPVQVNYPIAIDCPVVVLGGGNECLLLFNDRDIDNWFKTGSATSPVNSSRLHAFSDAIALVGVKSTPNVLSSYDTARAILTNGNAKVGFNLSNNKVTLLNSSTSLGTALGNLLTALSSLATALNTAATAFEGNPTVETAAKAGGMALGTASTALTSAVNSVQTLITGLLE
jgi:hypothetical protein